MINNMYRFTTLYSFINKVSLAVGFCFPGMSQLDTRLYPILILNSILSTIPTFYIMACSLVSYFTSSPYDIKLYGFTADAMVVVFDTFYYLFCKEKFIYFLSNFDKLSENFVNSDFVSNTDVNYILNAGRKFNSYMKCYVVVVTFSLVGATIFSIIGHYVFAWNNLFLEVPCSIKSECIFIISVTLQAASAIYTLLKIACSRSVIFIQLYHITFYLKTLRDCLDAYGSVVKRQKNSNVISKTDIGHRLHSWIELHQKILR